MIKFYETLWEQYDYELSFVIAQLPTPNSVTDFAKLEDFLVNF
jgi:hypothetical protein